MKNLKKLSVEGKKYKIEHYFIEERTTTKLPCELNFFISSIEQGR